MEQSRNEIFICQKKYAAEILKKFHIADCKHMGIPISKCKTLNKDDGKKVDEGLHRTLIESFLYLTATRPYIMFAVSILSRYMHSPPEKQFSAAKRILRYLKSTINLGVMYKNAKNEKVKLLRYSDSNWGGCLDDFKSTSRNFFFLGSGIFTWSSKK